MKGVAGCLVIAPHCALAKLGRVSYRNQKIGRKLVMTVLCDSEGYAGDTEAEGCSEELTRPVALI